MNSKARQKKLRDSVAASGFDILLVSHLPNIRYLCGFTGSAGFLVLTATSTVFLTDVRYDRQSREEVQGAKIVIARKALVSAVAAWMGSRRKKGGILRIGVEGEHLTLAEKKRLADELPSGTRLSSAPGWVERARMVKDDDELESIRAAVRLGAQLFEKTVKVLRAGVKEVDVAAEMEYAARQAGADAMSFPTIIASGERSALPHGRATQKGIGEGFVVCDFGVILSGYCSDQTRTVWVGSSPPPIEERQAYEAVKEAQQAAISAVKPGIRAAEVDEAARKVLRKAGLGRYFTHSTGHGVGLEIHEAPRVAVGQQEILQPGMVITIEPGVYFPGKWGIRIEDMVAVSAEGCEVLTPTSKEFLAV